MRAVTRILVGGLPAVALALLAACSGDDADPYVERPVEEIYTGAHNLLLAGELEQAAREFDEVERQHPYSQWATRAQIMAAYAHYQAGNYGQAIAAAERFALLHPGHEDVVYARFLIGQSYYERISDVERDQSMARLARDAFRELQRLFPDSPYGRDVELKLELTEDHLAGKEMDVGRWYQGRREYLAAINRFRNVVDDYETTTHVPEALLRLVESYLALGVVAHARNAAAVLGHNYPGSDWYRDAHALLGEHGLIPGTPAGGDGSADGLGG